MSRLGLGTVVPGGSAGLASLLARRIDGTCVPLQPRHLKMERVEEGRINALT